MNGHKAVTCLFLILLSLSYASAFSVATLYGSNYPLKMKPGESKETFFLIRNIVEGDSSVTVSTELAKGVEIAELIDTDKTYKVPFGEEVEVPVRISIPKDAKQGKEYKVAVIFRPVQSEGKGGVGDIQFIVNIGKSFPVIVSGGEIINGEVRSITLEEDEGLVQTFAPFIKENLGFFLIIIAIIAVGILILIVLIVFMLKKNKEIELVKQGLIQAGNQQIR